MCVVAGHVNEAGDSREPNRTGGVCAFGTGARQDTYPVATRRILVEESVDPQALRVEIQRA